MTPDRLRQIEELYHSAREASAPERRALLAQADSELRSEVESLLARESDRLMIDRAALDEAAADLLVDGSTMSMLRLGARLGPYQIQGKIGEGGMGEVFRAVDTRLGRLVAIKLVNERFSDRFAREARAISALNHPNICTLYDIGPNYLVMELLEGETLGARLKKVALPIDQAHRFAAQIVAALAEAHERGVVHRDLKPGNIMLTKSGVKVVDFGLAALEGDDTITGSRMVMGTPAYMAPEQREGKPSDARADLYSFGLVLYEMLTGARATEGRKPIGSKALEKIVSRCLEMDPARRWQSAGELAAALEAPQGGEKSRTWLVPAAVILAVAAAGGYFYTHRPPKLTDKDTIVLADFVNNTGDPLFDGTLRQGLAVQLEQSPFLKIMDDQQVQGVLRLMSLPRGTRITNPIAHEICLREGVAATIDGTIASLGKSYVLTIQAIACHDGATLAREQTQAPDKEHVLEALGTVATAMRGKLGESHDSVQRLNRPLPEATTASLEALQSYSAGYSLMHQGDSLAAVPSFERAVKLDPNFAMAYYFLGVAFDVAGDIARMRENAEQAFRLIDRVTEHERDSIASFHSLATGELDKAIDGYQSGIRDFPRRWGFHNNLGVTYIELGRYEEGLQEGLEAARLQANAEPSYRRQLDAYLCLDRLGEAKQLAEKLRGQGLDRSRIHQRFLEIAYIEEDQDAIAREIQWFAGKQEEYLSFGLQAAYANVHGKRRESHKLFQRAAEMALRRGVGNAASDFEEADARAYALAGNCQAVRRLGRPALALAICGDAALAGKAAAETSKLLPNGTLWNAVHLPAIRAAVALGRDPAKSVELLASAAPYERAYLEVSYLRGLAYLHLKDGMKAADAFQKIVDHKGANWANDWRHPFQGQFYSLSYLGMARGYSLAGDKAKATAAFQDFLALWKDADEDLPVLQQAKAEFEKLRLERGGKG